MRLRFILSETWSSLKRNVPRYQMLNQGVPTPSRFSQYD